MLLALCIAVVAVGLGLLLGLAPAVSRQALGPLRTLALTSVLAVVGLHLLPEALGDLGVYGLLAFAAGLALPRWLSAFGWGGHHHHDGVSEPPRHLGLSLGYWGLIVHHIGDGLALGAYSRLDADKSNAHTDVLFALVLHTVPFVAVIAAGYARISGPRIAVRRAAGLAIASAVGVLAARLTPPALVDAAQAWIAAGVSGLLLHGLSHDLERDLPSGHGPRLLDLALALLGAGLGTLGATLDAHEPVKFAPRLVLMLLEHGVERLALPLALGLICAAFLCVRESPSLGRYARLAEGRHGGVLAPEAFFVTLGLLGWGWAVTRDAGAWLLRLRASAPHDHEREATPASFVQRLDERVDAVGAWALLGTLMAAVIGATVPAGALAGNPWLALAVALAFSLSVPLHALAAPQLALVLLDKGLFAPAALVIAVLSPFAVRKKHWLDFALITLVTAIAYVLAPRLALNALFVDSHVSWAIAAVLGVLWLRRIYLLGFRGFLAPITHWH